ncbi:MAG: hypothetical protein HY568_03085 [Candidatus Latescibacteria bacterium]|nr:hypothetical protein [Candidatus Latescibacterota bacterium]
MVRSLRAGYSATPILTAGDTLFSNDPGAPPFIFYGSAAGLGALDVGKGLAEVYVAHGFGTRRPPGGSVVSRLLLDTRNAGVLAADYLVEPEDRYVGFDDASLAGGRAGFIRPTLLLSEGSTDGAHRGVVAAVDVRNGTVAELPWLGRDAHWSTTVVPTTSGKVVAITAAGSYLGETHLYMFLAQSDADFLAGLGDLYVFRPDARDFLSDPDQGTPALTKGFSIRGEFAAIDRASTGSAASLEAAAQAAGCLNFTRLKDLAVDRERLDAFYITDSGESPPGLFATGSDGLGSGRLYRMALDPFDPTRVASLEVLLDGAAGDDLYRPSDIDTDEKCVMILEDPGERGLHAARILRYDTRTRRLEAVAECAERDRRRRLLPQGVGGAWESSGILNASDFLGEDSWLLAVQAHTLRAPQSEGWWGESGQLLLLRGGRYPRPNPSPATDGAGRGTAPNQ